MPQNNLKTIKGRKDALRQLYSQCKADLKTVGVTMAPNAVVEVYDLMIHVTIKEPSFGSQVTVYADHAATAFRKASKATMSYSSSGSFNPETDKASYWKTLHAASMLNNWSKVVSVVNKYCFQYKQLEETIFALNS